MRTWEREFKTTLKVLKAYPANKLDFKPHERSMSAKKLAWSFPTEEGSGVILTLSTPGSRMSGVGFLGYGVTCGATRHSRAAFVASDRASAMTGAIANLTCGPLVD